MSGVLSTENPKSKPATKRGGYRLNAGRKKSKALRYDPSHGKRPELSFKHAVHVILRTRPRYPGLRQRASYHALRRVLLFCLEEPDFRIVHISIQNRHLHLIVEAKHKHALTRGMQRFAIRAARALNAAFDFSGKVFAFRYHAKQIKAPDYARNALAYVLNNWRRHREDFNEHMPNARFDALSSAPSFAGWTGKQRFSAPPGYEPLPVSQPRTQLLRFDWEWYGLIDPFEVPGPLW